MEPKFESKVLKYMQYDVLKDRLAVKLIHGVYWNQTLQDDKDASGCHLWLSDGRLQAENEALIIAMQDGVVLTRHYRACVLKEDCPRYCRVCGEAPETIGHLLSACP